MSRLRAAAVLALAFAPMLATAAHATTHHRFQHAVRSAGARVAHLGRHHHHHRFAELRPREGATSFAAGFEQSAKH